MSDDVNSSTRPSRRRILVATERETDVAVGVLIGEDRYREIVLARHCCMWVMHQAGHSLSDIGRTMHRDHTTIWHALQRVRQRLDDGDEAVASTIRNIEQQLAGTRPRRPHPPEPQPEPDEPEEAEPAPMAGGSVLERAWRMRRGGARLVSTAKVVGIDPLMLARLLGERVPNEAPGERRAP